MELNLTDEEIDKLSPQDIQALMNEDENALSPDAAKFVMERHEINTKRNLNQTVNKDGSKHINVAKSMHPEIGAWDRFVAKNFASNPDAQLGYMKKEYPHLEFDKLKNGELVARNKNEVDWQRLDEEGTSLMDLTDIATDVGQGVAEGVGGGLAGLATMNPLVGMGTASALGVGTEYAKQGVGSLLGVPDNIDHGNAAISGGASIAMPAIGKYAVKPAWGMVKKAAPYVGEFMSGIDKELLKNINLDDMARNSIQKMGVDQYAQGISDRVKKGFADARLKSGQAIGANLNTAPINISSVKNNMDQSLNSYPQRVKDGTKWTKDLLEEVGDDVSPQEAIRLKNDYYALAEGDRSPLGYGGQSAQLADMSSTERDMAKTASTDIRNLLRGSSRDPVAYDNMAKQHHDLIVTSGDKRLKPLNDKLGTQKYLESWNKPTTMGTDNINETLIGKVKNYTGENLDDQARQYQSWQLFQDPKMYSPDHKTRAATTGALLGGALGFGLDRSYQAGMAGGLVGGGVGNLVSSPWALKKYGQTGTKIDNAGKYLKDKVYLNPKFRSDKGLINLMSDENER